MTMGSPQRAPDAGALFDLSFTKFLTVGVVKFVYVIGMALLALAWLVLVIVGFTQGFGAGLAMIIVASIAVPLYLLMLRIWLELIVIIFRIGENTSAIAAALNAGPPTGGFPVMTTPPAAPSNPLPPL